MFVCFARVDASSLNKEDVIMVKLVLYISDIMYTLCHNSLALWK